LRSADFSETLEIFSETPQHLRNFGGSDIGTSRWFFCTFASIVALDRPPIQSLNDLDSDSASRFETTAADSGAFRRQLSFH
jgi:hypothetical protein